jgi:acyl-CoA synthetase (AMP-forming)/AMP-acid ligase II
VLAATVRAAARRFGDLVVLVDPDGSPTTYADLDRRSDAVAAGLVARGVGPGDRVVLRLASDSRYVVAYAGAAKVGAITAGINPRLAPPEQEALVDLADPAVVLAGPDEITELERWGRPAIDRGAAVPVPLPDPDRPVAIVFTSGTTGLPKGAVFGERQLDAVASTDTGGAWAASGEPGPAMLASTQFAHIGFTAKLPWYLRLATRTHILGRWRADEALRTIAEQRMPSIGGIAPQVALMLRSPEVEHHDWDHVKTIIMGGAASPPALVRAARERFGAAYSIRYSSTESGGCGTGTAFDADDEEALFTVGSPRPGVQVRVRDDAGGPLPDGEVGELWLRSPTQMTGYWRDPDATAATIVDGWLRTGDLARIDERGLVRLAGRSKEMFIRGGYNVYPAEVEAELAAHPAVAEVAVVPRPDPVMGEIGVALVAPRDHDHPPSLDELRGFLHDRLAAYKLPEALRLVDALPLTPVHKVDRRSLAQAEAEARPEDAAPERPLRPRGA